MKLTDDIRALLNVHQFIESKRKRNLFYRGMGDNEIAFVDFRGAQYKTWVMRDSDRGGQALIDRISRTLDALSED